MSNLAVLANLVQESIQYQNTIVFKELTNYWRELAYMSREELYGRTTVERSVEVNSNDDVILSQKYINNNVTLRSHEQRLEGILNHHFNVKMSVVFADFGPAIRIFDEYVNSSLIRNDYRHFYLEQEKFVDRFVRQSPTGIKAGVNIMTAKVSGLFAELPSTLYYATYLFERGKMPGKFAMTPEEHAAVVLHEVGHFFTYCEAFSTTVTTNYALTAMDRELTGTYDVAQREVIISNMKKKLDLTQLDAKALAGQSDKKIIEVAVVTEQAIKSRSELGISIYDHTASEFLADQFCTRMGAGRSLVTGLDKIHRFYGPGYAYMGTTGFVFNQIITLIVCTIPGIGWLYALCVLFGATDEGGDNTYDTNEARFRRIRQDMISRLKDRKISDGEKLMLLDDLKSIDEVLEYVHDKRSIFTTIGDFIVPAYRRYRNTMELQKQLERIGNNNLFLRSAELSVL